MAPLAPQASKVKTTIAEWALAGLLVLALLLGGGGSPSPAPELALQIACAIAGVAALWAGCFANGAGRTAWWLVVIVLALPAIQVLPLPPNVWSALPGRDIVVASLENVGASGDWRPLSIAPHNTMASLLALGPPLLVLLLTASSSDSQLRKALGAIIVMALAAAVLGAVQVASAGQVGHLYEATHRGWVTGFFANRNAAADLFLIAVLALLALTYDEPDTKSAAPVPAGAAGVIALLMGAACIMTGSRVGVVLLAVLAMVWLAGVAIRAMTIARKTAGTAAAGAATVVMGLLLAGWYAGGLRQVAARFGATRDMRAEIWPDTIHAIERFWPVGSGLGTFQEAFAPSQRLETLGPAIINRAHNDFLELTLEGGLLALILLFAIAALLLRSALLQWRASPLIRSRLLFAGATLAVLAAHSLVDYPLRTMALAVLGAFAAGIVAKLVRPS